MKFRRLSEDEVTDKFAEDQTVILYTRMWARGAISDNELLEMFTRIRDAYDMNPVEIEEEGLDGGSECA